MSGHVISTPPSGSYHVADYTHSEIERYVVNVSRDRACRWNLTGPWPTKTYLLYGTKKVPCLMDQRFANVGETIHCVVVERAFYNYHGLKFEVASSRLKKIIHL